jgi:alanine racemase
MSPTPQHPNQPTHLDWHRPTVARVDLDALAANAKTLSHHLHRQAPAVEIMAVVKADAYGHGAAQCAPVLAKAGATCFGVAIVEEGIALRRAGIRQPVVILGGLLGGDATIYRDMALTPVVFTPAHVHALATSLGGAAMDIHVKVDTGMGRLGARPEELGALLDALASTPQLRVQGVMTHMANADNGPNDPENARQVARFVEMHRAIIARGHNPRWTHIANSAATLKPTAPLAKLLGHPVNLVRTGIATYGLAPTTETAPTFSLSPVMTLGTRVAHVKTVPAGEGLSYGHRFVTQRPSRIATLPIGYADGFPRGLTNTGQVLIRGLRAPIVGTVCMDLCLADVTDVETRTGAPVVVGDEVVLFGLQKGAALTAAEVAGFAGTIHYELLARLSPRIPRVYSNDARTQAFMMIGVDEPLIEPGC